ncbi:hypothetical protein MNBD_BACTEROID01-576 [hydrothermal vent metagenome]|uniref:Type IX secretion system membrane protein PorP/SprF n=1 Tax=hydrothermal vent metagenome TaxID=652676 RepID=A0A3B0TIE6_9ZZZZ
MKIRIIKKYFLIIILSLGSLVAKGQQDAMFTQYMFNMQSINPAYAGMWERLGFLAMVRKQWAGIDRSPLTELISFHSPIKNEFVGVGFNIIHDQIGRENRLSVFGDYSYKVLLSNKLFLRLGVKFGFVNYNNNLSAYKLYPDNRFDPAYQGEIDLKFMPNFGVGGFLYTDRYYISLSIPKLITNDFKANYNNYSSVAETRHIYLTAGYLIDLPNNFKFKPSILVKGTIGAPLQVDIAANLHIKDRIEVGLMYRTGDALAAITQIAITSNITIGYAFDFTLTEIREYQNGTHEFYFSYDIDFYRRRYLRNRYF